MPSTDGNESKGDYELETSTELNRSNNDPLTVCRAPWTDAQELLLKARSNRKLTVHVDDCTEQAQFISANKFYSI